MHRLATVICFPWYAARTAAPATADSIELEFQGSHEVESTIDSRQFLYALLTVSFLAMSATASAQERILLTDDFEDGRADDAAPATWLPGLFPDGIREVRNGSYVMDPVNAIVMSTFVELDHRDVSIRTQARFLTEQDTVDFVGLFGRDDFDGEANTYWAGIRSDGLLAAGMTFPDRPSETKTFVESPLDPINGDVLLQLDLVGDTISLTAWSDTFPKPDQPQLSFTDGAYPVGGALGMFLDTSDDGRASAAALRFVEVVAIPEPSTFGLIAVGAVVILISRCRLVTRDFRATDR